MHGLSYKMSKIFWCNTTGTPLFPNVEQKSAPMCKFTCSMVTFPIQVWGTYSSHLFKLLFTKICSFFWGKHGWLVGINSVIKSYKSKARFILTLSTKFPGLVLLCCSQLACILIYFTTIFFTNRWTVGFKIISYELQWLLDLFINLCVCAKQGRYNKNTVLFKCGQPASLRLR